MKKTLVLLMLMIVSISTSAYDFVVNGIYYNILSETEMTCEVTKPTSGKYAGDINIPSHVTYDKKRYNVTSIGDYAFEDCTGLTSITLPESLITIGDLAFQRCTGLTSFTIPEGVTGIDLSAFSNCKGLTSITLPESLITIGGSAFSGCIYEA